MLYSDEIYIEDFKRTYTEAYRKGFIDGFNERGYLLTYIGNDHIKAEQGEPQTIRCPKCGRTDYIRDMEKDMGIKGSHYKYKCINCNTYIKDEPTISKMEQVDKDINVRSKTEPQTERSE